MLDLSPHYTPSPISKLHSPFQKTALQTTREQLTGQEEEDEPVHDQDGPEDGDVEQLEPAAGEADGDGARGPVPELELGQPADEGLELVVVLDGEPARRAVLHVLVHLVVGGVELGGEEGEEEVEEVDAEGVGDCAVTS